MLIFIALFIIVFEILVCFLIYLIGQRHQYETTKKMLNIAKERNELLEIVEDYFELNK